MSYKAETVRLRQYVVKLEEQGRLLAKEAMHWRTKWTQSNYQNMQMYSELSASSRVRLAPSTVVNLHPCHAVARHAGYACWQGPCPGTFVLPYHLMFMMGFLAHSICGAQHSRQGPTYKE